MNTAPDGCPACGTTRTPGDWRYCGRCGAVLRRVAAPTARSPRRTGAWVAGLAVFLLVVPVVRFLAPVGDTGAGGAGAADRVEVPSAPVAARPGVRPCEGGGCSFWTAELGAGDTLPLGDTVYHLANGRLHAVSPLDGRSRWQRPVSPTPGRGALFDVGAAGPLSVVHGGVVRSWTPQGQVRWEQDLGDLLVDEVLAASGGLLVLARRAGHAQLVRLDADTGQPAWELAVERAIAFVGDRAPVVLLDPVTLAAVDPVTGVPQWSRVVPGRAVLASDAIRVAVASSRAIDVVDASSGERLATFEHPVAHGSWMRVYGPLLAVFTQEPLEAGLPARTGVVLLGPDGTEHGRWHGVSAGVVHLDDRRLEPLLVVATRNGAAIDLEAFGPDGARRWTFTHDVPLDSCCWWLQALADGSLLLAPTRPGGGDALRLEGPSGTRLERFAVRGDAGDAGRVSWHGTLAVHRTGQATRLMGPRGTLELAGDVRVVTGPRPIILGTADGLLRIDERLVLHTGAH